MTRLALALLVLAAIVLWTSSAVAVSTGSVSRAEPQAAGAGVMGDVNCSGAADSIDALQVLRSVASLPVSADCLAQAADVDCSTQVDSIDGLLILRFVASLPVTTPAGCTPIGGQLGGGPSSADLIDAALAAHEISEEQALVYKVYASFGDSRLPPQYKGDDSATDDSAATDQAAISFNSLSAQTQANLAPFLLTPSAPGSWLELQTVPQASGGKGAAHPAAVQWTTYTAAAGKVKVWAQDRYPGDAEKAQGVAAAMTGKIWDKLIGLMGAGHAPLSDAGLANNGGDGALDIYLVHISDRGVAEASDPANACQLSPRYLLVNSDRPLGSETSAGILQTVAHETFHAFQFTYPLATGCWTPEYAWFTEASAKWVEDYVYPNAQSEQPYAEDFLKFPGLSLDEVSGNHEYGAYLFPFYLARMKGQPLIVRTIWEHFGSTANSLQAVNEALQEHLLGGFEEVWPKVALYNWNRPPVDDYKKLDKLKKGADTVDGAAVAVTLGGASSRDFEVSADVSYLAALYHHFSFGDDSVRWVVFDNTVADYQHAKVQALVKIGGEWKQPEDWTHDLQKTFCRDIASQHIEELAIIISYSNWEDKDAIQPAEQPKLTAKSVGCTDWVGTASAEVFYFGATFAITVSGLRFELNEAIPQERYVAYKLTRSPAATWRVSGTWPGGCTPSGEGPLQPADGTTGDNRVYGALVIDREEDDYQGVINGHNFDAVITLACPGGSSGEVGWPVISIMSTGLPDPKITKDGLVDGEYLDPSEAYGGRWHWHFDPAPPG